MSASWIILVVLLILKTNSIRKEEGGKKSGYAEPPVIGSDGVLTVHVMPHSHNDVGWLETYEDYFDGVSNFAQKVNVNHEISTIIGALKENPARRFS